MSVLRDNLAAQGLILPLPATPIASYVATQREGDLLFVSGQLPRCEKGMLLHKGLVGLNVTIDEAIACARLCGLHILAQVEAACGLDAVKQCIRLGGYVACASDFERHAEVINGASDLMFQVFAEKGRHTRAAVGVASLPLGAPVEIEAIFALS